jgi:hypothetical protein
MIILLFYSKIYNNVFMKFILISNKKYILIIYSFIKKLFSINKKNILKIKFWNIVNFIKKIK